MINPIVSFVISSYNHRKFLAQALESVINQTYKNIEVIIVDDNSNDGSIDLINEYASKFSNIYPIIHNYRWGRDKLHLAYKEGISFAKGSYVCMLNSDDLVLAQFVEKNLEAIQKKDAVLSHTDYYLIDSNGKIIDEVELYKNYDIDVLENRNKMALFNFLLFRYVVSGSFLFFKKEAIKNIEFLDEKYYLLDLSILTQIATIGEFAYVPKKLACFRRHKLQTTGANVDSWNIYMEKLNNHFEYNKKFLLEKIDPLKTWNIKKDALIKLQKKELKRFKMLKHYSIGLGAFIIDDFKTARKHFFYFFINPLNIINLKQFLRSFLLFIDSVFGIKVLYNISKILGRHIK
ncbi:MAG: glycosyltransferase [bacterium]|nr:glycosyltransferase [bacterium]